MSVRTTTTVETVEAEVVWLNRDDLVALLRERYKTCNDFQLDNEGDAGRRGQEYWKGARNEAAFIADALDIEV